MNTGTKTVQIRDTGYGIRDTTTWHLYGIRVLIQNAYMYMNTYVESKYPICFVTERTSEKLQIGDLPINSFKKKFL
jgi:hypothetical protein